MNNRDKLKKMEEMGFTFVECRDGRTYKESKAPVTNTPRTLDQVYDKKGFGIRAENPYILVDVDNMQHAELLKTILDKMQYIYIGIQTKNGMHFWFRSAHPIKSVSGNMTPLGFPSDYKSYGGKQAYACFKVMGGERQFFNFPDDLDKISELPHFLKQLKLSKKTKDNWEFDFIGLPEGAGNDLMYRFATLLLDKKNYQKVDGEQTPLTPRQIHNTLGIINNLIWTDPMEEDLFEQSFGVERLTSLKSGVEESSQEWLEQQPKRKEPKVAEEDVHEKIILIREINSEFWRTNDCLLVKNGTDNPTSIWGEYISYLKNGRILDPLTSGYRQQWLINNFENDFYFLDSKKVMNYILTKRPSNVLISANDFYKNLHDNSTTIVCKNNNILVDEMGISSNNDSNILSTTPIEASYLPDLKKVAQSNTNITEYERWVTLAVGEDNYMKIHEMIGDICLPANKTQAFYFLTGSGSNGKSTLINKIVSLIIGRTNKTEQKLHKICSKDGDKFHLSNMENKLLGYDDDINWTKNGVDFGQLKALTGNDTLNVEKKGAQGYDFPNFGTYVFNANELPIFNESGEALKRRMQVIHFGHTFLPKDYLDPKILDDPEVIDYIFSLSINLYQKNCASKNKWRVNHTKEALEHFEMIREENSVIGEWFEAHGRPHILVDGKSEELSEENITKANPKELYDKYKDDHYPTKASTQWFYKQCSKYFNVKREKGANTLIGDKKVRAFKRNK